MSVPVMYFDNLRSLWATVSGCRVHTRASYLPVWSAERSSRKPLILIHGFGVSSAYWVPLAARLTVDFPVFAPDLPGHGKTGRLSRPLDVPGYTDFLVSWMNEVKIRRASLIGNSMGCQIAVDMAVRYPERVDRMVLIGPTTDAADRHWFAQIRRLIQSAVHEKRSLYGIVARDYLTRGHHLLHEFRVMLNYAIEERVSEIQAPTLVLRGERDRVAPQRWVDALVNGLPRGLSHVVPGAAHAAHYSAVDEVFPLLGPFLDPSKAS